MSDTEPTAWERIQTRPIGDIVAEVFEEMGSRSDSDPLSPWADLALALCERVTAAEARLSAVGKAVDDMQSCRMCCGIHVERIRFALKEDK